MAPREDKSATKFDGRENQQGKNKRTPRKKKMRRKLHRPKVIQEGNKATRTLKSATPKQAKDNQTTKRSYVRKKNYANSSDTPSDAIGESMGSKTAIDQQAKRSESARRSLNFEAMDVCHVSTSTNALNQSRERSTSTHTDGPEVAEENSEAGLTFDLKCTLARPSGRVLIRENRKEIVKMWDMKSISDPDCFQPSLARLDSNSRSDVIPTEDDIETRGTKRDRTHVDDTRDCHADGDPRDYEGIDQGSRCSEMSGVIPHFPETHKKRRTQRRQAQKHTQVMQQNSSYFDQQRQITLHKVQVSERMSPLSRTERFTKKRSELPIRVCNLASIASIMGCSQLLSTPVKPRPQSLREVQLSDGHLKTKTNKRTTKGQAQLVNPMSINTNGKDEDVSLNYGSHKQRCVELVKFPMRNFEVEGSNHLKNNYIQDCQSRSTVHERRASLQPRAIVLYMDPLDDIVQKLKCLNIDGGKMDTTEQSQNALIPFGEDGVMVPYKGQFEPTKKQRPRAKVDLDPETNRVWKLLMEKEAHDEADGSDMDKEKWWEEERRIFRGRAELFMSRMHLVQGNRRFSQWKGSVVDSVVGVFLTQNVSDFLSSSAFMDLAARFPVRPKGNSSESNREKMKRPTEQGDGSILTTDDAIKSQEDMLCPEVCDQDSTASQKVEQMEEKEIANSNISLERNPRGWMVDYIKGKGYDDDGRELQMCLKTPQNMVDNPVTGSCTSAETEDRRWLEDVVSSQSSVSTTTSMDYLIQAPIQDGSSSEMTTEADLIIGSKCSSSDSSNSVVEPLQIAEPTMTQELYNHGTRRKSSTECCSAIAQQACKEVKERTMLLDEPDILKGACSSIYTADSHLNHVESNFMGVLSVPSKSYHFQDSSSSGLMRMEKVGVLGGESGSYLPLATSEITSTNSILSEARIEATCQQDLTTSKIAQAVDSHTSTNNHCPQLLSFSETEVCLEKHSCDHSDLQRDRTNASSCNEFSLVHDGHRAELQQEGRVADSRVENTQHTVGVLAQMQHHETQSTCLNSCKTFEVVKAVESNLKGEACSSQQPEIAKSASRKKVVKAQIEEETFDWDNLRKEACCNGAERERSNDRLDSLDWEAVRSANINEFAQTIKDRGMHNVLAQRIKDFLDRLVRDHGSTDLEWLRNVPPDKAKDYLLSIRGLGLKSVECIRLLTLNHHAFPVDTNVGRICVRLGWVPLQPLQELAQLHLLELYPMMDTIQKYLWPRLCNLDQETLYELHYQMITFGKVFCTKRRPNCNACPMKGDCKHFASELASAKFILGSEEKNLVSSIIPSTTRNQCGPVFNSIPVPQLEGIRFAQEGRVSNSCVPIIEEPSSPEPERIETFEPDIEDLYLEDLDEIPYVKLNLEEHSQSLQNPMQANNVELEDSELSKAIVALSAEAASIPMPQLKKATSLRTEHQVYELPDNHPLLERLDQREPDDPCPYLLAIWTPGETAQSTQQPETSCNSQDIGKLCDNKTCFDCSKRREVHAQIVRGTLLIPCRTAMRGSFPLNGTYFQVNEVFADHDSSCKPIDIPREWIWNLPRRTVYIGISISAIFRGLTTEGIQHCFWRGYVCVRGFDRKTRRPMPLTDRLHFSAYKASKNRKAPAKEEEQSTWKTAPRSNQDPTDN